MTRSVADAVAILEVIAGYDPADPTTAASQGKMPDGYTRFLVKDGLKGARIGVLRPVFDPATVQHASEVAKGADPDVVKLTEHAIADMKRQGAQVLDPVAIPDFDKLRAATLGCDRFKFDINNYLAGLGPRAPLKSLEEVIASKNFHPSIEKRLVDAQAVEPPPQDNPKCQSVEEGRQRLREAVLQVMDGENLDALVYPTWNNPPRLIGDLNTPHGNNSPLLSPPTGFPAITVPMGFTRGVFPAGVQFLGRPWSEPVLIKLAYAYEQATRHRRPPASVPPLPDEP
jgi:Asp-tRNA(Asn)/Glu-tRNA(Gln) amidotransferase A subunit family amidase